MLGLKPQKTKEEFVKKEEVKKIQATLILLGYNQVTANGEMDEPTQKAIESFQNRNGHNLTQAHFNCEHLKVQIGLFFLGTLPENEGPSPVTLDEHLGSPEYFGDTGESRSTRWSKV